MVLWENYPKLFAHWPTWKILTWLITFDKKGYVNAIRLEKVEKNSSEDAWVPP
jgi:hypothetical protein